VQMQALQRAGPVALMATLLRENGINPQDVARASYPCIDLDTLQPDDMHPLTALLTLLDRAAHLTGDDLFSVKLAMRYRWHNHGIIHQLSRIAPTLRQALLDFSEWQRLYSQSTVVYLHRLGQDFAFGYGVFAQSEAPARHLYMLSTRAGVNYLEDLTGGAVRPVEIHLCISPPENVAAFRRLFDCPVLFNQSQSCLILSQHDIDWPMPHFNPKAREAMRQELEAKAKAQCRTTSRVQRAIRPQLLLEDPSMEGTATALGFHPRTLRRALAAEGTDFETIRDEVRHVVACELLTITHLSIGEISGILAFASHAAFVRAFQRWTGMTPSAWREQKRIKPSPST